MGRRGAGGADETVTGVVVPSGTRTGIAEGGRSGVRVTLAVLAVLVGAYAAMLVLASGGSTLTVALSDVLTTAAASAAALSCAWTGRRHAGALPSGGC